MLSLFSILSCVACLCVIFLRCCQLLHAAAKPIEPAPQRSQSSHPQSATGTSSKLASQSTAPEASHEQSKPSGGGMFARFKNAASSLVAPLNLSDFEASSNSDKKGAPAKVGEKFTS